jgi:hypothetical protein
LKSEGEFLFYIRYVTLGSNWVSTNEINKSKELYLERKSERAGAILKGPNKEEEVARPPSPFSQ